MNITEEHQNYKHFESWVSEYTQIDAVTASLPLLALVRIYLATFPGRTDRLVTDLVQVARMWTGVQDQEKTVRELNKRTTHHRDCVEQSWCHPECTMDGS